MSLFEEHPVQAGQLRTRTQRDVQVRGLLPAAGDCSGITQADRAFTTMSTGL
jgi:hypothetical protein